MVSHEPSVTTNWEAFPFNLISSLTAKWAGPASFKPRTAIRFSPFRRRVVTEACLASVKPRSRIADLPLMKTSASSSAETHKVASVTLADTEKFLRKNRTSPLVGSAPPLGCQIHLGMGSSAANAGMASVTSRRAQASAADFSRDFMCEIFFLSVSVTRRFFHKIIQIKLGVQPPEPCSVCWLPSAYFDLLSLFQANPTTTISERPCAYSSR